MKNPLLLLCFIAFSVASCTEECPSCPPNEAMIDNECQCVGFLFNNKCYSKEELLAPVLTGGKELSTVYYSADSNCSDNYHFSTPQLIALGEESPTAWTTVARQIALLTSVGHVNAQTFYNALVQRKIEEDSSHYISHMGDKGFHEGAHPVNWTETIDGETCYLRPYMVKLDTDFYRIHFIWETEAGEEKDRCTKVFHR